MRRAQACRTRGTAPSLNADLDRSVQGPGDEALGSGAPCAIIASWSTEHQLAEPGVRRSALPLLATAGVGIGLGLTKAAASGDVPTSVVCVLVGLLIGLVHWWSPSSGRSVPPTGLNGPSVHRADAELLVVSPPSPKSQRDQIRRLDEEQAVAQGARPRLRSGMCTRLCGRVGLGEVFGVRRYGLHAVAEGALAHMPSKNACNDEPWAESAVPIDVWENWLSHSPRPHAVSVGYKLVLLAPTDERDVSLVVPTVATATFRQAVEQSAVLDCAEPL